MFFDHYPYTNFHNVNLDWVLQAVKAWGALVEENNIKFINLEQAMNTFRASLLGDWSTFQNATEQEINSFEIWTQTYLQNLDITDEINTKLDDMLSSGTLSPYFAPYIRTDVETWLDENISPTSPAIDSSLTIRGAGADALTTGIKVGELKNNILHLSSIDYFILFENLESRTHQGVTYTWSNDFSECNVIGTSTGVSATYLYSDLNNIPNGIELNKTYNVLFNSSDDHCYLEFVIYYNDNTSSNRVFRENGTIRFPDNTRGMYIRLRVSNGTTVNLTVPKPILYYTKTNQELAEDINSINSALVPLTATIDSLNLNCMRSVAYISSVDQMITPYDDANHIMNGDCVTYGSGIIPLNAPNNFNGGTFIQFSGRNRNVNTGGTVQFCMFKTGELFVRIRWGSNIDAYLEWHKIKYDELNSYDYIDFSMFYKIGVVGDSFASGSITHPDNTFGRYFDLSWIQILGRETGADATNYSYGGLSTKTWLTDSNGLTKLLNSPSEQLYMLALGINDYNAISGGTYQLGEYSDMKTDYTQNPDTFYGNYARIIENIKNKAPNAIIIMFSIMRPWNSTKELMNPAIEQIASKYNLPYINCDTDTFFTSQFYSSNMANNHPVACTYSGMAKAIKRLVESFIKEHPNYFREYYGLY